MQGTERVGMAKTRIAGYVDEELALEIERFHRQRVALARSRFVKVAFVEFKKPSFSETLQILLEAGFKV
jgi:hypothetical protein